MEVVSVCFLVGTILSFLGYVVYKKFEADGRADELQSKNYSLESTLAGIQEEIRAQELDLERQRHDMRRLALERDELRSKLSSRTKRTRNTP